MIPGQFPYNQLALDFPEKQAGAGGYLIVISGNNEMKFHSSVNE
jgi:hypothetical protein